MNLNHKYFKALIFHKLKSLSKPGDTLEPSFLEFAICQSFSFQHVGGAGDYADGILGTDQMSVKTRMLKPKAVKSKKGRDFQTSPDEFFGPKYNKKQKKWTNGVEIVQRRQQVKLNNDRTADPPVVGSLTLEGFQENLQESYRIYNTNTTYEMIVVHGYNRTEKRYIVTLFWAEYTPLDNELITWTREGCSVCGYIHLDGVNKKVCERIDGNAKREATCFKEYKDLTKYKNSAKFDLPLPDPWHFDLDEILAEIDLKEKNDASVLFE